MVVPALMRGSHVEMVPNNVLSLGHTQFETELKLETAPLDKPDECGRARLDEQVCNGVRANVRDERNDGYGNP